MVGTHWVEFSVISLLPVILFVAPWIIGFAWVRPDANQRGQPGFLWALLTFPLSWVAVLAYLIVRAITQPRTWP